MVGHTILFYKIGLVDLKMGCVIPLIIMKIYIIIILQLFYLNGKSIFVVLLFLALLGQVD